MADKLVSVGSGLFKRFKDMLDGTHAEVVSIAGAIKILAQSAVPVILAPNGTIDAAGVLTLGTSLPTTYSGGAWVRLPAGAVVGGLAGLYWCTFSLVNTGAVKTLFVDPATPFTPYVPSVALVAAVGSGVAYTQTTGADITLCNVTVPGGSMGANGALRVATRWSFFNSAGNKIAIHKFGGSPAGLSNGHTTSGGAGFICTGRNRGVATAQTWPKFGSDTTTGIQQEAAVNTGVDQPFIAAANIVVATDHAILEGFTIEVLPS
jgi:hypothetical protein